MRNKCRPLWKINNSVRCSWCATNKRGCSFDLGIRVWPKVIPSAEGIKTRAEDAAKKRQTKGAKQKAPAILVVEDSDAQEEQPTRRSSRRKSAKSVPVVATPEPGPLASTEAQPRTEGSTAAAPANPGTYRVQVGSVPSAQIWTQVHPIPPPPMMLVDFVNVERIALNPRSTRVELEVQRSMLINERIRERLQIKELSRMVESRRLTSKGLIEVLNDEILERGGEFVELDLSSDEERAMPVANKPIVVESEAEGPPPTPLARSPLAEGDADMESSGAVNAVEEILANSVEMRDVARNDEGVGSDAGGVE